MNFIIAALAFIVGGFLLLAAIVTAVAPKHSDTPLHAKVILDRKDLDTLGIPMYLKITNNDAFDWKNCIVLADVAPGTGDVPFRNLKPEADLIGHGQTATLRIMDFEAGVNGGGERLDPRGLFNMGIKCETPNGLSVYAETF